MIKNVHDRIEAIAGAIALGEATDEERMEYRQHIAGCDPCLREFGGECEIERVASTVALARESEVWAPSLGDVVAERRRRRTHAIAWGSGVFTVALAASFGLHALLAASLGHIVAPPAAPIAAAGGVTHVVLEERVAAAKMLVPPAATPQPERRLVVTHNVVQIARAPLSAAAAAAVVPAAASSRQSKPPQIAAVIVHPNAAAPQGTTSAARPVPKAMDTSWRTVAQTTTTSVLETAPESLTHSAESLQVARTVREVAPLGGETAINPQPPMIAYDEGAEGTTAFEVHVDERGVPTKCVITKSAGYVVLDESVCKAAMNARYTPKMVGGRAVPGVYRDAFTFHMSDQTSAVQGVPQDIPVAGPPKVPHSLNPAQSSPFGYDSNSNGSF